MIAKEIEIEKKKAQEMRKFENAKRWTRLCLSGLRRGKRDGRNGRNGQNGQGSA